MQTSIAVDYNLRSCQYEVFVRMKDREKVYVALPPELVIWKPGERVDPTFTLDARDSGMMQSLVDNLYRLSLRPSPEVVGDTPGALKATQEHLKDLQELIHLAMPLALRRKA